MEGAGCVIKRAISSVWNTAPLYVTSRSITRFQPDVSAEFVLPSLFGIFVPSLVNRMFVTFCWKYFIIRFSPSLFLFCLNSSFIGFRAEIYLMKEDTFVLLGFFLDRYFSGTKLRFKNTLHLSIYIVCVCVCIAIHYWKRIKRVFKQVKLDLKILRILKQRGTWKEIRRRNS